MTDTQIPVEIVREVVREQERMGWPDCVPAYAELPYPGGKTIFKGYRNLNVGDSEQLVEHHTRKARKAIARFHSTKSPTTARTAGHHILYARLYRCLYFTLTGTFTGEPMEDQMPFPIRRPE